MSARPMLVTGGAGFIGSHTCKLLAAVGYLPVAIARAAWRERQSETPARKAGGRPFE